MIDTTELGVVQNLWGVLNVCVCGGGVDVGLRLFSAALNVPCLSQNHAEQTHVCRIPGSLNAPFEKNKTGA